MFYTLDLSLAVLRLPEWWSWQGSLVADEKNKSRALRGLVHGVALLFTACWDPEQGSPRTLGRNQFRKGGSPAATARGKTTT